MLNDRGAAETDLQRKHGDLRAASFKLILGQPGCQRAHNGVVAGSSPAGPTTLGLCSAASLQGPGGIAISDVDLLLVEHRPDLAGQLVQQLADRLVVEAA